MTDRTDVARGRDIVARWCGLAEQRLDHLTELFETGRWRRYHSEREFIENIREAKVAVETWHSLLEGEGSPDNLPVDLSWVGKRSTAPLARREPPTEPVLSIAPELVELVEAPPVSVAPDVVEAEPEPIAETVADAEIAEDSALEKTLALTLDIVGMHERYPLLRNTL